MVTLAPARPNSSAVARPIPSAAPVITTTLPAKDPRGCVTPTNYHARMQSMTGGQALAAQLAREGVRHIFGVPGVQLDYAVDGLAGVRDRIAFWNTRHEQAASYM